MDGWKTIVFLFWSPAQPGRCELPVSFRGPTILYRKISPSVEAETNRSGSKEWEKLEENRLMNLIWIYHPAPGCKNRHHQDDITFLGFGILINLHLWLLPAGGWTKNLIVEILDVNMHECHKKNKFTHNFVWNILLLTSISKKVTSVTSLFGKLVRLSNLCPLRNGPGLFPASTGWTGRCSSCRRHRGWHGRH